MGASENEVEALESLTAMNPDHLPKLVECGFIEWDREHNEVSKAPPTSPLAVAEPVCWRRRPARAPARPRPSDRASSTA